jgi:hypothetical protein
MNIQELEHYDHVAGSASECQNLLAQYKAENPPERVNKNYVNWLSSIGFYVVIGHMEKFCIWTDAFAGVDTFIIKITRSAAEAEDAAADEEFMPQIIFPEEQR